MGRFKAGRPRRRKVKRFTREVIETLKGMVQQVRPLFVAPSVSGRHLTGYLTPGPFYDMKKRKRGRYWLSDLDRGPE